MRLLTIARACFWSAVGGSLIVFALLQLKIPIELPDKISIEDLSKIWHMLTALLVGGGALGVREIISVDGRLNKDWYWVSKVVGSDDKVIRVAFGKTTIANIDDWKARENTPQNVIFGSAIGINNEKAEDNAFHATQIFVARDRTIFYEWKYSNGEEAFGWTRITFLNKPKKWMFGRAGLRISGTFCMATSSGSGTIQFFGSQKEALAYYKKELPDPMPATSPEPA